MLLPVQAMAEQKSSEPPGGGEEEGGGWEVVSRPQRQARGSTRLPESDAPRPEVTLYPESKAQDGRRRIEALFVAESAEGEVSRAPQRARIHPRR
jgi:hypothetical protein